MFERLETATRGIALLAIFVLVESIQLVIILGFLSTFLPVKMDSFNAEFFPVYQVGLKPNYQMSIYHIFIVASIGAQAIGVYFFRRKLEGAAFQEKIRQWLFVQVFWIFVQCYAIFKILIYNSPAWAWDLFYFGLAGSLLSWVFGTEIRKIFFSTRRQFLEVDSELLRVSDMRTRFRGNDMSKNGELFWRVLFVVIESIQIVIGLNWLLGHAQNVQPFFHFGIFVLSCLILWCLAAFKKIRIEGLKPFIIAETLLTYFLLSALFKMIIYDYRPIFATKAYHVLLVLAVLNKFAWPFLWQELQKLWRWCTAPRNLPVVRTWGDAIFVVFIVLTIYIPDPQAVLARMFIGDEFIHTGSFIMSPGWAYVSGCVLDVDVISRYGLGIPIVIGSLAKAIGGYNHLNVFLVILWIAIIYYLLCYLFLRLWLKSFLLSAAAILVGIKTQMFYTLAFPQPFTYPSGTPVRFMLDIVFMFCIWGHLKKQQWRYLLLAALCAGLSFFCIPETGLYLVVAFMAYLALRWMVGWRAVLCALAIPVSAGVCMWLCVGHHLFTQEFWDNFTEFSKFYTAGFWAGPFYGGLQYGQFWDLLVGMLFPIVYVLTILIIGTLCILKKLGPEHFMPVVLAVYGLMAHHYYVVMATANNYYPRDLPFVFIIFYWVSLAFGSLEPLLRRRLSVCLVAFCAYCLWTNHHYLSYPNLFNFSRNPMVDPMVAERLPDRRYYFNHRYINYPEELKVPLNSLGETDEELKTEKDFSSDEELKAYYKEETDFSKDVRLIQIFTPPAQPVALLSSYDTEMLMQANRKPFFYYFRVFSSRPLRMRTFGTVDIWTKKEMNRTIDQLENGKTMYVFMERVFLADLTPKQYANYDPALMGILDYVKSHYRPYAYGKFLVAMKRVP